MAVLEWVRTHAMVTGKFVIDLMDILYTWISLRIYMKMLLLTLAR